MPAADAIADRMRTMPRALVWGIWAAVLMIVFFIWDSTIAPISQELSSRIETKQSQIETVRAGTRVSAELQAIKDTVVAVGPIELPGTETAGRDALAKAINDILNDKSFGISEDDWEMRTSGRVNAKLTGVPPRNQIQRLAGEFKFQTSPEQAAEVIAALESNPDIELISRLRLTRLSDRKVEVNVTLETWVLNPMRRGRRS